MLREREGELADLGTLGLEVTCVRCDHQAQSERASARASARAREYTGRK